MHARVLILIAGAAVSAGSAACSEKRQVPRAQASVGGHAIQRAARAPRPRPPPPRAADGTYSVGGLRYFELVTGGAKPEDPLPLVLLLHGHGGAPESFLKAFSGYRGRARFIAPFAFDVEGAGYSWFPVVPHHFNNPAQVPGEVRASDRVAAGLIAIAKVRPTVGRFIAAGFSQGAGLTYALSLRHPSLFAGACAMSGQLPAAMFAISQPTGPRPEVHGYHGDRDTTTNLADAKRTIAALSALGYSADLKVFHGIGHELEPARDSIFGCLDRGVKAATEGPAPAGVPSAAP